MQPEDRDFVVATWCASFRRSAYAGLVAMDDWFDVMTPQLEKIIDRPRVHVLVIADPTETDRIADLFGHLVWEDGVQEVERAVVGSTLTIKRPQPDPHLLPLVYFCYVKQDYRGHGFARGLMRAAAIDPSKPFNYVCQTHASTSMREKGKLPSANWRPLLGRYTNERKQHERRTEEQTDLLDVG